METGGGLVPDARKQRADVNYRIAPGKEKCSVCDFFHTKSASCDLVAGNISIDGICDHFDIAKKYENGKDKQFYIDQAQKAQKKRGTM